LAAPEVSLVFGAPPTSNPTPTSDHT